MRDSLIAGCGLGHARPRSFRRRGDNSAAPDHSSLPKPGSCLSTSFNMSSLSKSASADQLDTPPEPSLAPLPSTTPVAPLNSIPSQFIQEGSAPRPPSPVATSPSKTVQGQGSATVSGGVTADPPSTANAQLASRREALDPSALASFAAQPPAGTAAPLVAAGEASKAAAQPEGVKEVAPAAGQTESVPPVQARQTPPQPPPKPKVSTLASWIGYLKLRD